MPSLAKIEETTLSSGIALVNGVMPFTEAVTMLFLYRVGSRDEAAEQAGISHLFEHMLFKGTRKYPNPKAVAEQVEGVGGIFNAFTDREMTGYWCKMPRAHFERGLDVICDMVCSPLLSADDLEREKQVVVEELRAYYDSPVSRVSQILDGMLWREHPLGREIGGSIETVQAVGRDDMSRFFDARYVASNMVIAVAGNVSQDELVAKLEPPLRGFRTANPPKAEPFAGAVSAPVVEIEERPIEQVRIATGMLGASMASDDRHALGLLSVILGESMSSRLFTEVREKRGLAYDISSGANLLTDTGSFEVACGVPPDKACEALNVVLTEIEKLHDELVTDTELAQGIELAKGRSALRLEDSRAVAQFVGIQKVLRGEVRSPEQVLGDIAAVSKADIQRVAKKYLQRGHVATALVGPFKDKDAVLKVFAQ